MNFPKFLLIFAALVSQLQFLQAEPKTNQITREVVANAEKISGLNFSDEKRDLMLNGLNTTLSAYENIRRIKIPYTVPPAVLFNPIPVGFKFEPAHKKPKWSLPAKLKLPANLEDLAFCSVGELSFLIKSRKISSEQLTQMYLKRLKQYGPKLECVITLTEDLALKQARRADREIAAGKYRGPLHGIPYGAKDLLSTKGIRTTWGSVPFKDQVFDEDATVIQRLEKAGAILVAKTTMGELAWGEVWFGGMTRNPWAPKNGSSGSSAGSAAGTSAGLFAFAIGSETHGSILSPASICGVTGLRPTYGRVSRAGVMSLSWSMDKLGPIGRTVEDCALVFDAIYGSDGVDQTLYDAPFNYRPKVDLRKLRIGFLKNDFAKKKNQTNDLAALAMLKSLGAKLIPIELPKFPVEDISFVLSTEGATAFDELTRSNQDDLMVRQIQNAWPNVFRRARFVPAVEYLQAQRIRHLLIQEMAKLMNDIDVYVAPWDAGDNVLLTNLTGHPSVGVPNGFSQWGTPTSINFVGKLFGEADLLAVAKAYQDATGFHRQRPDLSKVLSRP
ncbi:MAG: amidase [Verrucomicrobiota bacterium]